MPESTHEEILLLFSFTFTLVDYVVDIRRKAAQSTYLGTYLGNYQLVLAYMNRYVCFHLFT